MSQFEGRSGPPLVPGYAVSRRVGRGATGAVWAAVEEDSGEQVAIKIAEQTAYRPGELLQQATREIAVLEGVASEHVVRLRRIVHLPGAGVALVLDLAEGGSLADLVGARGRLSEGEVVTVCTALATALAALHDAGVIHGDLAAGNVLFTGEGKPMIADFASARLVGESDPPLVAGTPGFVAPEVARGDIPTEASDAYGLGALAWFAATGRPRSAVAPPDGAEAVGFLGAHLGPVVRPLLSTEPQARPALLTAAAAFYGAYPAVPVGLVDGIADPAAALTRRIRAQAAFGPPAGPGRPGAGRHAAARRPLLRVARQRAISSAMAVRNRCAGLRWGSGARAVVVLLVMVALFGLGRTVGARLLDTPAESAGATTGADVAGSSAGVAPGPTPAPSPAELVRSDPRGVLAAIADARAAALMAADARALEHVEAPGSPMLLHDTRLVSTLSAAQSSYAGLSFAVRSAELVAGTGDSATVRAVVDRSAYQVLGPGARIEPVEPQGGGSYTYRLVVVDGRWRLVTVE